MRTSFYLIAFLLLITSCGVEKNEENIIQQDSSKKLTEVKSKTPEKKLIADSIPFALKGDPCDYCNAKKFYLVSVHPKEKTDAFDSLLIPLAREKFLWDCIFRKTKFITETKYKSDEYQSISKKSKTFSTEEKKELEKLNEKIDTLRKGILTSISDGKDPGPQISVFNKIRQHCLEKLRTDYCSKVYHIYICACSPGNWPDHYMEGMYKAMGTFICRMDYQKLNEGFKKLSEKMKNAEEKERIKIQLEALRLTRYSELKY